MWTRVTGASAPLAIAVAFLFVFSLSDVGISRSLVLEENTSSSSSSIRMVGPRLEFFSGQTGIQNFPDQVFRNLEKAEKQFAYISGLDLSEIPGSDMLPAVISPVQLTEKEMIDQAVLRVAYAQYLVSLLALKEVTPTAVVLARQEVKPDEILAPDVITAGSIKVGSTVPDVLAKEGIEPVFMDIVEPLPRVQSLGIENRKESGSAADLLHL
ncbi:MAG: hypothetical protein L3J13_11130, partial [Devosiaceae bacterium]|nr:hypothetical protein [Devosiaceae bacterium]